MNTFYITAENVMATLSIAFPNKQMDLDDIRELCAQVELLVVKDIATMSRFEAVPLTVTSGRIALPCNVFTIEDVYDSGNKRMTYFRRPGSAGAYLYNIKDKNGNAVADGTVLYLNYTGIPVDENGELLIWADHQILCETYCKLRLFEEDTAMGRFSKDMYFLYENQLPGQVIAARQSIRHMDMADREHLLVIRGNMLPRIGNLPLYHKM